MSTKFGLETDIHARLKANRFFDRGSFHQSPPVSTIAKPITKSTANRIPESSIEMQYPIFSYILTRYSPGGSDRSLDPISSRIAPKNESSPRFHGRPLRPAFAFRSRSSARGRRAAHQFKPRRAERVDTRLLIYIKIFKIK